MVEVKPLWHLGVVQISCGDNHCLVLTAGGRVLAFGRGKHGQLGLADFHNRASPEAIKLPLPAIQVTCPRFLPCSICRPSSDFFYCSRSI